jgi:Family of unknown function (DUF6527)
MSKLNAKFRLEDRIRYYHYCPACRCVHCIWVSDAPGHWKFNGNLDSPTFTNSVKVTYNGKDADTVDEDGTRNPSSCCHYNITNGKIDFHNDCSHSMNNLKGVEIPDLPDKYNDSYFGIKDTD